MMPQFDHRIIFAKNLVKEDRYGNTPGHLGWRVVGSVPNSKTLIILERPFEIGRHQYDRKDGTSV